MKTNKLTFITRVLLGLAFVIFGLDGFLHFIPIPPARPAAQRFIGAIVETGYFFQMVKVIELFAGALLLSGRAVTVGLVLLAPILVGITSIHLVLNPEGLPLMAVLLLLYGHLVRSHWASFAPMLTRAASRQLDPARQAKSSSM